MPLWYHAAARSGDRSHWRSLIEDGRTGAAGCAAVVGGSAHDAAAAVAAAIADALQHNRQHVTVADLCAQETKAGVISLHQVPGNTSYCCIYVQSFYYTSFVSPFISTFAFAPQHTIQPIVMSGS